MKIPRSIPKRLSIVIIVLFLTLPVPAQLGLWTSTAALAAKPMSDLPWEVLKEAADAADPNFATVSDQDSDNNVEILAAAIVYARTGTESYKSKVVSACERLVNGGHPGDRTLAWARETGAYALAADLVGYRDNRFKTWLRAMAETYEADDHRTLLYMFKRRPNNWGTHAFGSLTAIYAYLQDTTRLNEVRDYWIQAVTGPKPELLSYGSDKSWHLDQNDLRLINPKGAQKQGLNIDGIAPDDMRRNGSFSNPPPHPSTSYHWGVLQGIMMAARIFERLDMPIWQVADSAIYRAGYRLQVQWENDFGGWKAEGDDLWLLPFFDDAYGTNWSEGQPYRVWKHGKNVGWPYVVWNETVDIDQSRLVSTSTRYKIFQNYPNPFNPGTTIRFFIPEPGNVKLGVYDISGNELTILTDGFHDRGEYNYRWEALDREGNRLPSGIYLCQFSIGSGIVTKKMLLLR